MRFIKRQSLDRRTANNTSLYSDAPRNNVYVSPIGAGSLVVPVGTVAQRDSAITTPTTGMMRYTSDASTGGELQIYQGGAFGGGGRWRSVRFKEQGGILQQNLGGGDGTNTLFGPLNSTYYNPLNNNASNVTVGGQNIIVIVENVIQVSGINYTISALNPSVTTVVMTIAGQGASSQAIYPSISLIGAAVTGSDSFQASTVVTAYVTDPNTDALVSITFAGKPTQTSIIPVNTGITITESTTTGTGYYLQFTAPVPYGKVVIALLGFDQ